MLNGQCEMRSRAGLRLLSGHAGAACDDCSLNTPGLNSTGNTELALMSDLVFIAFPSEEKAEEVRQKVLAMQSDYVIEVGDAVIATRDANGRVKLNQLFHTTAAGAAGGAFWGMLMGWLFLMPVAGAAIGAATGAISGKFTDVG